MRLSSGVLLLSLSVAVSAVPPASSKDAANQHTYIVSLGKIYTAIKAVEYNKELCAERYPEYSTSNNNAYKLWKKKHSSFLDEFEKRYTDYLQTLAKNNAQKYKQYVNIMNGKFAEQKAIRRAELLKNPAVKGKMVCSKYPFLIETELNPEHQYVKEVQSVRQSLFH